MSPLMNPQTTLQAWVLNIALFFVGMFGCAVTLKVSSVICSWVLRRVIFKAWYQPDSTRTKLRNGMVGALVFIVAVFGGGGVYLFGVVPSLASFAHRKMAEAKRAEAQVLETEMKPFYAFRDDVLSWKGKSFVAFTEKFGLPSRYIPLPNGVIVYHVTPTPSLGMNPVYGVFYQDIVLQVEGDKIATINYGDIQNPHAPTSR